jgi:hypothetical protein
VMPARSNGGCGTSKTSSPAGTSRPSASIRSRCSGSSPVVARAHGAGPAGSGRGRRPPQPRRIRPYGQLRRGPGRHPPRPRREWPALVVDHVGDGSQGVAPSLHPADELDAFEVSRGVPAHPAVHDRARQDAELVVVANAADREPRGRGELGDPHRVSGVQDPSGD